MKLTKLMAAALAALTAALPFTSDGLGASLPTAVYAETEKLTEIPAWVPQDFLSALTFRNTYGATHIQDGLVCVVFKERYDRVPEGEPQGIIRYERKEDGNALKMVSFKMVSSAESDYCYEIVLYKTAGKGDFEVTLADTWKKFSSDDTDLDDTVAHYAFSVGEDESITETDIYSWLPDCSTEYSDYVGANGILSVRDNYVVFCLEYTAGTMYSWKQKAPDNDGIVEDEVSYCTTELPQLVDGGTIRKIVTYKAVKGGYTKLEVDYGRFYPDDDHPERVIADCVVLDDSNTVLLPGSIRFTFRDADNGRKLLIPDEYFKINVAPTIGYKTDNDTIAYMDCLFELDKNPYICTPSIDKPDIFDVTLNESSIPSHYSLPEGCCYSIAEYENGARDVEFVLRHEDEPLDPGCTRFTLIDAETNEYINNDVLAAEPFTVGTDIRYKVNGQWMYTGPVYRLDANFCIFRDDLAKHCQKADCFSFITDSIYEVTVHENGSMDVVFWVRRPLAPGEARITLIDYDTGKPIPVSENTGFALLDAGEENGDAPLVPPVAERITSNPHTLQKAEFDPGMDLQMPEYYHIPTETGTGRWIDGYRSVTENENGSFEVFYSLRFDPTGDVNHDGSLAVSDLVTAQKWLLGCRSVPELSDWKAGDYCNDNVFDAFDLCLMRKALIANSKKAK